MNAAKLIMVVGLPGTGKSTFSRALAAETDAHHLNSDVIRAELGLRGKYAPEDKERVYRTLRERAEALLDTGSAVIVDATLYREDLRQPYTDLAQRTGSPILWIELHTGEETIRKRVSRQRTYSEADLAVYHKIKTLYEPLQGHHLPLDSDYVKPATLLETAKKFIDHEPQTN